LTARKAAALLLAAAVWLTPLWFVRQELVTVDEMAGISDPALPVYARPEPVVIDDRIAATAEVVYGEAKVLLAPDWRGVVTALALSSGRPIKSGEVVVAINGVDRIAVHSSEPFYRSLQLRDRGPDVERLQTILRGLFGDAECGIDGVYGRSTAQAVRRLSQRLGAEAADRFDPTWFVWLSTAEFTSESSELAVGAPAPSAGTVIATSGSDAARLELSAGDGSPLTLDPHRRWQFVAFTGDVFEIDSAGVSSADESTAFSATQGLAAVKGLPAQILGHIELVEPMEALAVGSSAVTVDDSGTACVWVGPESFPRLSARVVTILRSAFGTTWIDSPSVAAGDHILANPASFIGDRACT